MIKLFTIILLVILFGCSTNRTPAYYVKEEGDQEHTFHLSEIYHYDDSSAVLFKLERQVKNKITTISIHYPYFHSTKNDTLIISAFHYDYINGVSTLTDSTFVIESHRIKRNKLLSISHSDIHTTSYKLHGNRSELKTFLNQVQQTDSIQWLYYCYDCDTLEVAQPIDFEIENVGDKKVLDELYH